jgi:hypothetical protein
MKRALDSSLDADWNRLAGDLDWSCRQTGEHVADDLFSYASQVLAQPVDDYLPIEVTVPDEAPPADLVRSIVMCGELLRLAVASASKGARAWHPYGTSDPEGFAAMGIVEVLVHTHDIARGLDIDWAPPEELCRSVLLRLFPDAAQGHPSEVLLWCTGSGATRRPPTSPDLALGLFRLRIDKNRERPLLVPLCVKGAVPWPWSVRRRLSPSRSFVRLGAAP